MFFDPNTKAEHFESNLEKSLETYDSFVAWFVVIVSSGFIYIFGSVASMKIIIEDLNYQIPILNA